jgi:flagellar basal body-associated protein FliL
MEDMMADTNNDPKEKIKEKSSKNQSRLKLYLTAFVPMIFMFLGFFVVTKFINPHFRVPSSVDASGSALIAADTSSNAKQENKKPKSKEKGKEELFIQPLEPVLANPMGTGGRRFVRVGISLEVESKILAKEIEESKSKLQHQLILILSAKDVDSLTSPEGKTALQEEIRKAMCSELDITDEELPHIYFSEFIVQ